MECLDVVALGQQELKVLAVFATGFFLPSGEQYSRQAQRRKGHCSDYRYLDSREPIISTLPRSEILELGISVVY